MQSIFSWLRNTGGSNLFLTTRVISLFMDRRCNAYGVVRVCDHFKMDHSNGVEGALQDARDLPIGEVLIFPQQDDFAKLNWQLLNRRAHLLGLQFAYVEIVRIFGWLHDVVGGAIPGLDLNHLRTIAPFPQLVEQDIFQDGEEPAFDVAVRSQLLHGLHGAEVSCTKSSASA